MLELLSFLKKLGFSESLVLGKRNLREDIPEVHKIRHGLEKMDRKIFFSTSVKTLGPRAI